MLELKNIVKTYVTGDTVVKALDGVSLRFRENEFVSILGASGCGKTTMLNIIGGLDRYSDGDLVINGRSTKEFRDSDWDTYRNHSIGFVFQSYNLIPHQTVLSNVELALTLSGVSRSERRARAIEALTKVGLGDQLSKKPNQMSGGQMQRVAIARALVNNPDILLADEPTGALDTQTSVQIMDLLKEVAEDRLVIMVTHNPDLAEQYSTRIVKLQDGKVIGDTNPVLEEEYEQLSQKDIQVIIANKKAKKAKKAYAKKTSMSFGTAISLSFKNLLTKKGRTIMTSFAGSIGIIGIALILALSNGIQLFIDQVQEDTLSTYPLTIMRETSDLNAMMGAMTAVEEDANAERDPDKIYVDDSMGKMVNAMMSTTTNNLEKFKEHLDKNADVLGPYVNDIQYTYDLNLQVYNIVPDKDDNGKDYNRITKLGLGTMLNSMGDSFSGFSELAGASGMMDVMTEMIDNQELLDQQYDVVAGAWPKEANEIVLVVSKDNQISRMTLYMLGILDQGNLEEIMQTLMTDKEYVDEPVDPFTFDYFLNQEFYLVNTSDFFEKDYDQEQYVGDDGNKYHVWKDVREAADYNEESFITENGMKLKISGIIRPRVDATATSISSPLAYSKKLTDAVLEMNAESEILKQQKNNPTINITTGLPHELENKKYTVDNVHELFGAFDANTMSKISSMMGGMLIEDFKTASTALVEGKPMSDKLTKFITYASLLNDADKKALALEMYDKLGDEPITIPGSPIPMPAKVAVHAALSGGGVLSIDSREDFEFCLPSIAQDQQQYGMLIGILVQYSKDVSEFYPTLEAMLGNISLSKEFCVTWIRSLASQEEANDKASEINMSVADIINLLTMMAPETDATLDSTLKKLGDAQKASPVSINFYAKDFASKEYIEQFISDYNATVEEDDKIEYTDIIGIMMSSVSIIIDVISYVLIAFVSISLVVSSIMIGIITNISVLERIKEIGILRAIGASKKDISRVFNAETFIIGLAAGILGILTTILLCIPTNAIIQGLTGFENISATLPLVAALVLVAVSMGLTIIAGLIPAKKASRKDPVEALRTE